MQVNHFISSTYTHTHRSVVWGYSFIGKGGGARIWEYFAGGGHLLVGRRTRPFVYSLDRYYIHGKHKRKHQMASVIGEREREREREYMVNAQWLKRLYTSMDILRYIRQWNTTNTCILYLLLYITWMRKEWWCLVSSNWSLPTIRHRNQLTDLFFVIVDEV